MPDLELRLTAFVSAWSPKYIFLKVTEEVVDAGEPGSYHIQTI